MRKPKICIIGATGTLGNKLLKYTFNNKIKINCITYFNNKNKALNLKKKNNINNCYSLKNEHEKNDAHDNCRIDGRNVLPGWAGGR